ncbi:MAG: DUF559 domain-containing protein [Clostridia bacterium]
MKKSLKMLGKNKTGFPKSEETKKKIGFANKGRKLKPLSVEVKDKIRHSMIGKNKGRKLPKHTEKQNEEKRLRQIGKKLKSHSFESRIKQSNSLKGRTISDKCKKICKEKMLNGQAVYMNSCIQNPSKPQVELYNKIKKIYSSSVLNYPLYELNYSLDIAIPELKIWIESDGSYWHQDKEKDLKRQRKIESLGWKCIRYTADSIKEVPSENKIIQDILKLQF